MHRDKTKPKKKRNLEKWGGEAAPPPTCLNVSMTTDYNRPQRIAGTAWECPSSFRRLCTCHIIIGYTQRCWLLEMKITFIGFSDLSRLKDCGPKSTFYIFFIFLHIKVLWVSHFTDLFPFPYLKILFGYGTCSENIASVAFAFFRYSCAYTRS